MDELQQKRTDHMMWQMGAYVTNAVSVAVSNALNGKKSKAKYLEKPFTQMAEEEQNRTPADNFHRFEAWATVFNEHFKDSDGQG